MIIDDITQLAFKHESFDIFKQQVTKAALFVSGDYSPIAEHFRIQETMPIYQGPQKIEKTIPDRELHYLAEIDTIVMKQKTLEDMCEGLRGKRYGSLSEHMPGVHVKVKDLIFLIVASQCYASHLAKKKNMASIAPQDFDARSITHACGIFIRQTVREKNIAVYAYDHRKYVKMAHDLLL